MVPITECADWRLSDEAFLSAFRLPQKGAGELAAKHPMAREKGLLSTSTNISIDLMVKWCLAACRGFFTNTLPLSMPDWRFRQ